MLYDTRDALAALFNIEDPLNIVFTKNATEALNIAIFGLIMPGDHVITSFFEHNSVARPLRYLEQRGVEFTRIDLHHHDPEPALRAVRGAIRQNTRALIVNHASNVTGAVAPLGVLGKAAHDAGVVFIVDSAQTAGAHPIDVEALKIDLLAFTGHKGLLGPQGTGGLYVDSNIRLAPFILGGTGSASESDTQPHFMPDFLESGTPNTVGLAGLKASVEDIIERGVVETMRREDALRLRFVDGLRAIAGVRFFGHGDGAEHMPTISLVFDDLNPSEAGYALDNEFNIMVRVGLHCSPWAHEYLGTYPEGTVRFSFGRYTTEQDIEYALTAIDKLCGNPR